MLATLSAIRCRQIAEADTAEVAALLTRGFPTHPHRFWRSALHELRRHEPPPGLPNYGYLMECDGAIVGAVLLISSRVRSSDHDAVRCNLSSWYVEPAFRAYATLLVSQALQHKEATYTNVSAAPHTWPIIEAQGFSRYCDGVFLALPWLCGLRGGEQIKIFEPSRRPDVAFDPADEEILLQHAKHGCLSLWCATAERAYPFVFRPRLVKHVLSCAQLIYCGDITEFARFAGPIGRFLARRGWPFVIIDSNGPLPGLVGMFCRGSMTKYFKGPQRPRLGDLAFSEYAVLGI